MAKIKDFLLQLENDRALLDEYRKTKRKAARKDLAKRRGQLNDDQAELLQSDNLREIRQAIEEEEGGETVLCVVMVD